MITTSGRVSWVSRTAASPSAAWPTTSNPSSELIKAPSPWRTTGWSSASTTRMTGGLAGSLICSSWRVATPAG